LSALLDEIAMARARLKVVASLHGATLVLLPLVVWQLRKTGKAGDEILWPAFVGWPLFAVGILVALWWYDRSRLRPRQRQLEALHREYEREE
jgi:peptidoglycan/LPS O-acetylase OafA/YrhL